MATTPILAFWPPWGLSAANTSGVAYELLMQPSSVGEEAYLAARSFFGPKSYQPGQLPQLFAASFGRSTQFKVVLPESASESGTFFVRIYHAPRASVAFVQWFLSSSGAEVGTGFDLSAEKIIIAALVY